VTFDARGENSLWNSARERRTPATKGASGTVRFEGQIQAAYKDLPLGAEPVMRAADGQIMNEAERFLPEIGA
jgi:hypothetical protein